jgi:hypothetical protein
VSGSIELSLFDFIDDFADEVQDESIDRDDTVEKSSPIISFCETFFDQFFAALGHNISGFNDDAKRDASELAERLRLRADTKPMRVVIALFEEFCEMYDDVLGSYGSGSITYDEFHADYMTRLLKRANQWANAKGLDALAERITAARTVYDTAIKAKRW